MVESLKLNRLLVVKFTKEQRELIENPGKRNVFIDDMDKMIAGKAFYLCKSKTPLAPKEILTGDIIGEVTNYICDWNGLELKVAYFPSYMPKTSDEALLIGYFYPKSNEEHSTEFRLTCVSLEK